MSNCFDTCCLSMDVRCGVFGISCGLVVFQEYNGFENVADSVMFVLGVLLKVLGVLVLSNVALYEWATWCRSGKIG